MHGEEERMPLDLTVELFKKNLILNGGKIILEIIFSKRKDASSNPTDVRHDCTIMTWMHKSSTHDQNAFQTG